MTRAELITAIRRRTKMHVGVRTAGDLADVVLDVVLAEVTPVVAREWSGNEVLRRIRQLKSNPQSKE